MTLTEFAYLEPGASVLYLGAPAQYVRAARYHPMAAALSQASGRPITAAPVVSVMARLRDAYRDMRQWNDARTGFRKLTDPEILQWETTSPDAYAYFRAVLQLPDGAVVEVCPAALTLQGDA